MPPFFSIIIPSYNRADLIGKTIQSALDQTFVDFELIIVDDGSSDHTDEVISQYTDPRIAYYKKENSERGATRNYGIKKASGNYVTFIDSDDLFYTNALQNAHTFLSGADFPPCFAQAFEVIDQLSGKQLQQPKHLASPTLNKEIIKGNFLGCIGVFVKKEIVFQFNFEEERRFSGTEDWLLWLQLAARYPFYFSNIVCASMVEHQNRSVLSFPEDKLLFRAEYIKLKLLEDPQFVAAYGPKAVNAIYAHMLTYAALHLAMSAKAKTAMKYFIKGIRANYRELFTRRTLGILKTITNRTNFLNRIKNEQCNMLNL